MTASSNDLHDHSAHDHEHSAHGHSHDHGSHNHSDHMAGATSWTMAAQATLHCLTGCAIGEVLGMIIGTWLGFHNAGTVVLSIVLAFAIGYALTMRGVLRSGVELRTAMKIALAADTISIATMELIDNSTMVAIPGAMNAGLSNLTFWVAMVISLALAFLVATPVNKALISRGKGHAVVHSMH